MVLGREQRADVPFENKVRLLGALDCLGDTRICRMDEIANTAADCLLPVRKCRDIGVNSGIGHKSHRVLPRAIVLAMAGPDRPGTITRSCHTALSITRPLGRRTESYLEPKLQRTKVYKWPSICNTYEMPRLWVIGGVISIALAAAVLVLLSQRASPEASRPTNTHLKEIPSSPILGAVPPVERAGKSWKQLDMPHLGISISYPPSWKVELSDTASSQWIKLFPPGANETFSPPEIAIWFTPGLTTNRARPQSANITGIVLDGIDGVQYQDAAPQIPRATGSVEVPYKGGVLRASASLGPDINLVPQMNEVLRTLAFKK